MDWNETESGAKVALAIIKLPAKVHVPDPRYGGPVLINPGGPGGSGVDFLLRPGEQLQQTVDTSSDAKPIPLPISSNEPMPKYYDIAHGEGLIGLSPDSFTNAWARAKAIGKSCVYGENFSSSKDCKYLGYFMNATPTVRDIVEIVERHGEWRERHSRQWLSSEDRVSRVVLDGVVDSHAYYNSSALPAIQDSDKAFEYLLQLCFESGSHEKCGLYDPHGVEEIKSKLFSIIDSVKENPFPVPPSSSRGPQLVTGSDIDLGLHLTLYEPLQLSAQFFSAMHNLSLRDGSWFAEFNRDGMISDIAALPESCKDAQPWNVECQVSDVLDSIGGMGIECTDGPDLQGRSPETFKAYWDLLSNTSKVLAPRKALDRLHCPLEGNTSHPVLFIGNTLDPTTPVRSAHKIAAGFPDAVLLEQNAIGHCSIAAPSLCTAKIVRQYFQTGKLPASNKTCEVDESPFIGTRSVPSSTGA
ncbi:hypothetical protein N431DRAFT_563952 [Stipitochalara longipes BDJ]|nr:hypothetical protein N431DRAFT_563952 [Stipitochalara longipes BDJ]